MKVKVYRKNEWVKWNEKKREIERKGIEYKVIDIYEDENELDIVKGMGYRKVKVVVEGENNWEGFRKDMIS